MRRIRNAIVLIGLVGAAGWFAYSHLISEEAKKGMKDAAQEAKSAYQRISEIVRDAQGSYVKEDLPNRRQTEAQWAKLGY